jgi:hypothetical protein
VEIILLASVPLIAKASLWTFDKRLAGLAKRYAIAYRPDHTNATTAHATTISHPHPMRLVFAQSPGRAVL